jgi:predicted amidohydrolase
MEKLNITIVQPDIIWEDPHVNLERYTEMLAPVERTDIIVLPEMFTTGFSMQPEKLKESMDGSSVRWMKKLAREKESVITGSLIIEDAGKVFNRLVWVFPDEKIKTYDKRHLFTMGEENEHYSAGTEKLIVEYKSWRFCPLICYDLRFPVWSRNTENYDVLLYVANWPAVRHDVWRTLLQARAIENQSYCIGVNRIGKDGSGIEHNGDSCMIDARGNAKFMGSKEQVTSFEISLDELKKFREKFPVLNDRDEFSLGRANSRKAITK